MGSMSYCLLENTAGELSRAIDKISEAGTVDELGSEYEQRAFYAMWRLCREFLAEHERLLNASNESPVDLADKCFE